MKFYHGRPCRKCGGTLRRVTNRHCVTCHREAGASRRLDPDEHRHQHARIMNTLLLIYHPVELERLGVRQVDIE